MWYMMVNFYYFDEFKYYNYFSDFYEIVFDVSEIIE